MGTSFEDDFKYTGSVSDASVETSELDKKLLEEQFRGLVAGVRIEMLIDLYEKGNKEALLLIIDNCITFKVEVPDKYIKAFNKAIFDWQHGVRSLDKAFDVERKQFREGAQKRKWEFIDRVYFEVTQLHDSGLPIDDGLFEQVGAKFGLGKTTVSEYFYAAKAQKKQIDELTRSTLKARSFRIREDKTYKELVHSISKIPHKK